MSNFIFAILGDISRAGNCNQTQERFREERNAEQSKPIFKTLQKFSKNQKKKRLKKFNTSTYKYQKKKYKIVILSPI